METDSRLVDRPEGIEQLAADEVDTQVASLRASCVFQEVLQALGHSSWLSKHVGRICQLLDVGPGALARSSQSRLAAFSVTRPERLLIGPPQ